MVAWIRKFWKTLTGIITAIILIASLAGAMFWAEDRYNNQIHHDTDIQHERQVNNIKLDSLEKAIVMNLKQFQLEQQVALTNSKRESDYRYYSGVLEDLDSKIYNMRQYIRTHPTDTEAKEDYQSLKNKKQEIKQRLRELIK